MGLAMASNLQKYLLAEGQSPLRFWNRTASKGDALKSLGGIQCDSIAAVVRDSVIIFISTSNDEAAQAIIAQIISAGNLADKVIVDTTTVHPKTSAAISAELSHRNAFFVSAPVFGSAPMAAERMILAVVAGPHCAIECISPYVKDVIARDMLQVAEQPEKASLLKIIGNFLVSGFTEMIGEAHVFAEKSEVGCGVLEKLLEVQFGRLPFMISQRLTKGIYMPPKGTSPWSNLDLALKDVGHAMDCAASSGTNLRIGEIALDHLRRAKAYSEEQARDLDSAASYGILRRDAGLDFENEAIKRRDTPN
ncbi:hypothetical protein AbraIFM66951_002843 [Aspergillus brasiliensis]|uniref:6-phosphogluconate dehydrogenase NADP-binding domain-containing protein n=1 Tax=Aspergillus brasiliensis TaxID=319629 RepID=A0A9W5Z1G1_9EURO|nr:hypothetical protein AbraCBS73388_001653 [Aspergillus brasiliensis]GKZ49998.1 hypothetical protein AbraIFM66951_002843 [Aspergillus brasiliensis]